MHRILTREVLAPGVVRLWVDAPHVARHPTAGQFVMVRLHDGGERIPLTIADARRSTGAIALIVKAVGRTTRELSQIHPGEAILDIAGPLGRPAHVEPGQRVCCVAGGIGAAVVLPIARAFHAAGGTVTTILGARSHAHLILCAEARSVSDACIVATDDGSAGRKGMVTDALRDVLARMDPPFDEVVAAGPVAMMHAVCDLTRPLGLKTTVSLNPVMVDGTGMCGGCRVSVGGRQRFACVDGPEFDGHAVDFDQLVARLAAYHDEERWAAALYSPRAATAATKGQAS